MIPTDSGNLPFAEIAAKVKNIEDARSIQRVAATMAIENLPLDKVFLLELVKVANGEKTTEQLRLEVINQYARC